MTIVNPLNYKVKIACNSNVICLKHASLLFTRELIQKENHEDPILVDDQYY